MAGLDVSNAGRMHLNALVNTTADLTIAYRPDEKVSQDAIRAIYQNRVNTPLMIVTQPRHLSSLPGRLAPIERRLSQEAAHP